MAMDGQPANRSGPERRAGARSRRPGRRFCRYRRRPRRSCSTTAAKLIDRNARDLRLRARPAPLLPAPPLPSNGLPERLELKSATRVDLPLGGPPGDWVAPTSFSATAPPAFRAKAGRIVVLALTNRAASPPSSTSTAITSACWTASTTAGSRSGWTRSRSSPARPSASPSWPNIPGAGLSSRSRPTGPRPGL